MSQERPICYQDAQDCRSKLMEIDQCYRCTFFRAKVVEFLSVEAARLKCPCKPRLKPRAERLMNQREILNSFIHEITRELEVL